LHVKTGHENAPAGLFEEIYAALSMSSQERGYRVSL
jgi:hypothetical protein